MKEIADSTKISLRLLTALEEDRLEILPGKFFIKGIIRAYAKYLGLEEEAVLNMYYEDSLLQERAMETERNKRARRFMFPKDARKTIQYSLIFIFILLILFAVYYFFPREEESAPIREKTTTPIIQQEETIALPTPPPLEESTPEIEGLNIEISFVEKTWIQVYADGALQVDGIKNPGEKVEIKASEELLLNLGNAGGVIYNLNNKKGKLFGPSGSVKKNIKITLDNIQEYLAEEEEINS